jgi:hypothetical protein
MYIHVEWSHRAWRVAFMTRCADELVYREELLPFDFWVHSHFASNAYFSCDGKGYVDVVVNQIKLLSIDMVKLFPFTSAFLIS